MTMSGRLLQYTAFLHVFSVQAVTGKWAVNLETNEVQERSRTSTEDGDVDMLVRVCLSSSCIPQLRIPFYPAINSYTINNVLIKISGTTYLVNICSVMTDQGSPYFASVFVHWI